MRFRALSFDCYGTLIDWEAGIGAWLVAWAGREGLDADSDEMLQRFSAAQRRLQARLAFTPYRAVLAGAFRAVARSYGRGPAAGQADAFAAAVASWPPFPDTVAALAELRRQGRILAVASNIDDDLFAASERLLGRPFEIVVTAQAVASYKPALAHFQALRHRFAARGVGEGAILHIAQSVFHDIAPAGRLGWSSMRVDRRRHRAGSGLQIPSPARAQWTVASLAEAVALLAKIDPA